MVPTPRDFDSVSLGVWEGTQDSVTVDSDTRDLENHTLRNSGLDSFLYQLKYIVFTGVEDLILKLIFLVNMHILNKQSLSNSSWFIQILPVKYGSELNGPL